MSEKPVIKVDDAGLSPTFPVMAEDGTVEIPVLPRMTKLAAERIFTAVGLMARLEV